MDSQAINAGHRPLISNHTLPNASPRNRETHSLSIQATDLSLAAVRPLAECVTEKQRNPLAINPGHRPLVRSRPPTATSVTVEQRNSLAITRGHRPLVSHHPTAEYITEEHMDSPAINPGHRPLVSNSTLPNGPPRNRETHSLPIEAIDLSLATTPP
jgi:hypothetical protein